MNTMLVELVHCLILVWFKEFVAGGTITLTTPIQGVPYTFTLLSGHGYSVGSSKSISFEVKACQDAFISLIDQDVNNKALYHVAIGGWHNSKTVIRLGKDASHVVAYNAVLMYCNKYVKFEITWDSGKVELWTDIGNTWTKILSYSHHRTNDVRYIGVTTANWATGYWRIFTDDDETTTALPSTVMSTDQSTTTTVSSSPDTTDGGTTDALSTDSLSTAPQTNGENSTVSASTENQTVTDSTATSGQKWCRLTCDVEFTEEELVQEVEKLKKELKVNKKTTSSYKLSLTSAEDKRVSSVFIGYIGVVFLSVVFGSILIADLTNLKRMFRIMWGNIRSLHSN